MMNKHRFRLPLLTMTLLLSGCAALPDTTLGHSCGIPDGVGCLSTQEVYDRTVAGTLPGLDQNNDSRNLSPSRTLGMDGPIVAPTGTQASRTNALYAPPEELRIWVNHWRDQDGDLHDDAFIYVLIGDGQWLVRD